MARDVSTIRGFDVYTNSIILFTFSNIIPSCGFSTEFLPYHIRDKKIRNMKSGDIRFEAKPTLIRVDDVICVDRPI